MIKEEGYFDSSNGVDKVFYVCWKDEEKSPRAVLQIVHGMSEHILRYEDYAKYLVERGYMVVGADILGHGHTAKSIEDLGYFGKGDATEYLIKDIAHLMEMKKIEKVPYHIVGHSMGSFLVRIFLHRYELTSQVVMATGKFKKWQGYLLLNLAKLIKKAKGEKYRAKILENITRGRIARRIVGGEFDWLSKSASNIKDFLDDPLAAFDFTANGYINLARMIIKMNEEEKKSRKNKDQNILFISGDEDPMGLNGIGVKHILEDYKRRGYKNTEMILVEGIRHEVLNEDDPRAYKMLYDYLEKVGKNGDENFQ